MGKPIDQLEFWASRIANAKRTKEHFSVYISADRDWKNIGDVHREILTREIPSDSKVLDAGCGYGRMSELFTPENYTGVDFSPDFISLAKDKYPQYTFTQSNLKEVPFEDHQFDVAFCISIKKMVCDNLGESEWNLMAKELKRVAKKVLILEYEDKDKFDVL